MTASKLGMTRAWADTTLPEELGVADADEDALYAAMDWLVERQEAIEKRLARRHLAARATSKGAHAHSPRSATACSAPASHRPP